jgi:hypothetical protein
MNVPLTHFTAMLILVLVFLMNSVERRVDLMYEALYQKLWNCAGQSHALA